MSIFFACLYLCTQTYITNGAGFATQPHRNGDLVTRTLALGALALRTPPPSFLAPTAYPGPALDLPLPPIPSRALSRTFTVAELSELMRSDSNTSEEIPGVHTQDKLLEVNPPRHVRGANLQGGLGDHVTPEKNNGFLRVGNFGIGLGGSPLSEQPKNLKAKSGLRGSRRETLLRDRHSGDPGTSTGPVANSSGPGSTKRESGGLSLLLSVVSPYAPQNRKMRSSRS